MGDYFKKLAGDPTWDDDAGGSQMPCYETIAARNAAYPVPMLGQKIGMRRLCGNGYFEQMYNGVRWEVCAGASIIRDAGSGDLGYELIATGTAYVVLVSYTIPAGLIGSGEEWEVSVVGINGACTGNNIYDARLGENQILSTGMTNNQFGIFCSRQFRRNTTIDRTTSGVTYAGGSLQFILDLSQSQIFNAGVVPSTVGNVSRILSLTYRRVA